jgi:WXG100 family type VII secretion target
MAGKIGITHAEMASIATTIKREAAEMQQLLAQITKQVNGITSAWDGAAQSTFISEYSSMKPTLDKFPQVLNGIGQQVSDVATAYQNMDQEISSKLRAR